MAESKAGKAFGRIKGASFWKTLGDLFSDLFSPDRPTRRMALGFALSVIGIVAVIVIGGKYFIDLRRQLHALSDTGEQGKNLGEFIKKQSEEAKRKFSSQNLGAFTVELKGPDGKPAKAAPGVMNLAEIEIVVDCDEKETCEFIEDRMPVVRNEVTNILTAMDRTELLSKDGKAHLRSRIITRLNMWLPRGHIEALYFNKLVIS